MRQHCETKGFYRTCNIMKRRFIMDTEAWWNHTASYNDLFEGCIFSGLVYAVVVLIKNWKIIRTREGTP